MNFAEKLKSRLAEIQVSVSSVVSTTEDAQERLQICQECPHLFKPTSTCRKCGCFMTAKTKIASAKCPIGKW